jgi:hypothetical protein
MVSQFQREGLNSNYFRVTSQRVSLAFCAMLFCERRKKSMYQRERAPDTSTTTATFRSDEQAAYRPTASAQRPEIALPVGDEGEAGTARSLLPLLLLHLLPGVCIVAFSVVAAPLIIRFGFPSNLAVLLGFLVVGMPLELGILLAAARKRTGSFSLRGIVRFRENMPLCSMS